MNYKKSATENNADMHAPAVLTAGYKGLLKVVKIKSKLLSFTLEFQITTNHSLPFSS